MSLTEAIQLRNSGRPEDALHLLQGLLGSGGAEAEVCYQIAWTFDSMGKETDAAPFYERALRGSLRQDREGAFLGLGSTYRALGEYEKSLQVLDFALAEFPENRSLKVFRALTLYNLGFHEESTAELLVQLLETTQDSSVKSYEKALRFYSDRLNQSWA